MDRQLVVRNIINEEIVRAKSVNPTYSLRALAKKLSVQPSALSEILNGKRLVTRKMAERILERLCVDPSTTSQILKGLSNRTGTAGKPAQQNEYIQVNMDHYRAISEWYCFAIISLAETDDFQSNPAWIARRLNIKINEATHAVERLKRLGLLDITPGGRYVTTGEHIATTSDVASSSLRKSHHQNLDLARQSLEGDAVEIRDFSSMTMTIDPKKLPEAKKMLKDFRRKFCSAVENGKREEVYKLNIQFFPVSKREDSK